MSWKIVSIHLILIVLFLSVPVLSSPDFDLSFRLFDVKPFQRNFFGYLLVIAFFYVHYYLIVPRLLEKRRIVLYLFSIIGCFALIAAAEHFLFPQGPPGGKFSGPPMPFPGKNRMPGPLGMAEYFSLIVPFVLVLLFSYYLRENRRAKQIELDKVQTELQNLKYQLQPHFLFNSLNNIYSISILEPDKTPHYIMQLSEILRYLLTTEKEDTVLLQSDIRFCGLFIDLQRLRFGDEDRQWEIVLPTQVSEQLKICPFLLIPVVENVFKYGIHPDKPSPVRVAFTVDGTTLELNTYNRKNNVAGENLLLSQKLGLNKTRKRLQLLYPGKHHFDIEENAEEYRLKLILELEE